VIAILDVGIVELAPTVGIVAACRLLGRSRAGYYRDSQEPVLGPRRPRVKGSPRALTDTERQAVLDMLHSERFCDAAPAQVWATLLDENTYLCSISTMYRILHANHEVRDRRNPATHPANVKPELVATAANQVWSWDITKIAGPQKWTWFHLYVIIDVFSRYIVGWHVATRETANIAEAMIATAIQQQHVPTGQLTLHADRGTSMTSKPVAFLLADLGVTRSHSRPHVSNDNPYSEAHFKTLKYSPTFPTNFANLEQARAFCTEFFNHYNQHHRHSGIAFHTPADVHHHRATATRAARQDTLDNAFKQHPERFVRQPPQAPTLATHAWINQPQPAQK
jgi:putative transposase